MKQLCPFLFLWGMGLLVSCTEPADNNPRNIKKTPVEIIQVFKEPLEEVLNLIGTVEADREMKVSFKIGGKIKRIEVEEGDLVKKGALLAELDNAELLARKEKAIENKNKARRDQERMGREHGRRCDRLCRSQPHTGNLALGSQGSRGEDRSHRPVGFSQPGQ